MTMAAMIHDPQHGYLRPATQGDYDNLLTKVATLEQQLSDLQTQMGQAAAQASVTGGATSATPAGATSTSGGADSAASSAAPASSSSSSTTGGAARSSH